MWRHCFAVGFSSFQNDFLGFFVLLLGDQPPDGFRQNPEFFSLNHFDPLTDPISHLPIECDAEEHGSADDNLKCSPISNEISDHSKNASTCTEHNLIRKAADDSIFPANSF